ncbi:hypothetical protein [Lentilactobacillus otakiensis]
MVLLVSLIGWTLVSSSSFGELFVPGFVIPSVVLTVWMGIDWKRKQ